MTGENPGNGNPLADYFDRCADEGVFDEFSTEESPIVEQLLEQMNIQPGQKIVEPGCGAGRLTERLAEMVGPKGKVFAFDISPRMVEKCLVRNLSENVEITRACATDLPLADGEFDAVICLNTFPHLENHPGVLREFRRILREGGVLWVAHTHSREWVNSLHSSIGGVLATHLLPTDAEFEKLLRKGGFSLQFLQDLPDRFVLKGSPAV